MSSRGRLVAGLAIAAIMAVTLMAALADLGVSIQAQGTEQYFSETGHFVRSPFYEFFIAYGGVSIFGYPITEQFEDQATGTTVQYFQRARMEVSPGGEITLTELAKLMGYGHPALAQDQIPADSPRQRYFPATGHTSAYAFLAFYDANGGQRILGYPITEPFYDNDRLVQYFERARMEWWPERAPGQRVSLSNLGSIYAGQHVAEIDVSRVDQSAGLGPTPTPSIIRLVVVASVKYPVTRQAGMQTVSVLVSDQLGNPVQGAAVQVTVNSSMANHNYAGLATSEYGIALQTFPLEPDHPGKPVIVDVTVTYSGLTTTAVTSYMPWWGP